MNFNEFLTLDFVGLMKLIIDFSWVLVDEDWREFLSCGEEMKRWEMKIMNLGSLI